MDESIKPIKTISFLVSSAHQDALKDIEWCEDHPLGGSETAALRLASCFRELGFETQILTNITEASHHTCDAFISLRRWELFEAGILPGRLNYLWGHDDIGQPIVKGLENPSTAARVYQNCNAVILLSHFQQGRWIEQLNLPIEKVFLSQNGIPLDRYHPHEDQLTRRPPWAYYASNPSRGLELLVQAWPFIQGVVPQAQLHILSSMKTYNVDDSEEYLSYYDQLKNLPGVVYYGGVGQAKLRQISHQCRVLAYPCIFHETSCIVAMEAMAAGCAVAATVTGALPETAWRNPLVPIAKGWLDQWMYEVTRLLMDDHYYLGIARRNIAISRFNDWRKVAFQWLSQFDLDLSLRAQESA